MTDAKTAPVRDYSETLFLPKTDFAMRAELPKREPGLLDRWARMGLYQRLRNAGKGREKFVLHDGPPYANGHLHIGHALNKILKDLVVRSKQMAGFDAPYIPGWDCHGLPIEWRVEEEYRAAGKNKDEVPVVDFRKECRAYAEKWIGVQSEEFQRLGVVGDWANPYTTMKFRSEAIIASELLKFATSGQLYRGSKPVMWSIVEKTALAEAEVEYHEHTSHTIFVKFPVVGIRKDGEVAPITSYPAYNGKVVIWTTTPWTIPGNRAVAFSPSISYGLYEVSQAPDDNWTRAGEYLYLADELAESAFKAGRIEAKRLRTISAEELSSLVLAHPFRGRGFDFDVPVLSADFVTSDTGTGFVHIAPGHGADDYNLWTANRLGEVPHTVQPDGTYFPHVPVFAGLAVFDEKGKEGPANKAVIDALIGADALLARGRLRHQYPHSWRSKAPLIFRNTPQWFIAMDKLLSDNGVPERGDDGVAVDTLRNRALAAIDATTFYPAAGQNRLRGMIEARPDWVISRQRAWGVPICVFVNKKTGEVLKDESVNARIHEAFEAEGADAWFADKTGARFLGNDYAADDFEKINDILDVWFDSGSTHAFVLEGNNEQTWPAAMYLEGSDQHRGWFHSSLLESCGTRGRAPYDSVLTHGFALDEQGRKMSKSLGNVVAPQDVIKQSGADILRLWVAASDYSDDLRIGPEILKTSVDSYRRLRNTIRWMLGALGHFEESDRVAFADMPELEKLMLHRLWDVGQQVRKGYDEYDYKRVYAALMQFMTSDLSAFYFDVRKDALYCDPISSTTRKSALTVIDLLFDRLIRWLAPIIPFTAEEAWLLRHPGEDASVHLETFAEAPAEWQNDALAAKWEKVRRVRRVVTGALEIERANKKIGSSLEAAPVVYLEDDDLRAALNGVDLAEVFITSAASIGTGAAPAGAFRLDEVKGVAVDPQLAEGTKCARSWKISPDVGSDKEFPDITPRDARAMREWLAARE